MLKFAHKVPLHFNFNFKSSGLIDFNYKILICIFMMFQTPAKMTII